jgi:hypothetical protein
MSASRDLDFPRFAEGYTVDRYAVEGVVANERLTLTHPFL